MLNITKYYCGICNTKPDQISHHKSHLTTEKHKDKKELFLLKLKALTNDELIEKYNTIDINNIIDNIETIIVKNKNLNFLGEDLKDNNLSENKLIKMNVKELKQYCIDNNITGYSNKKKPELIIMIEQYNKNNNVVVVENNILKKKISGEILWKLEDNKELNPNYVTIKSKVDSVIKQCHNILYSKGGSIVGTKAQNDIMRILCLKILQDQFNDENSEIWDRCNKVKEEGNISDTQFDIFKTYCNNITEITKKDDVFKQWKTFVDKFLSKVFPSIYYENDNKFNCDKSQCIIELIKIINLLDINNDFKDAFSTTCGDIHESFRSYGGKNSGAKALGQFFTPRHLIHLMFHGIGLDKLIESIDKITIYDPCMGTGGFLTRLFKMCDIPSENIYGCETEIDTIKFGEMSLILTTGSNINNIIKCDSLCENKFIIENKFKAIVTNPPFGTSMNYKALKETFEEKFSDSIVKFEDIYPLNTNNGACLFVQHCVYMLAEGGFCAIVLPDGELFEGNSKWSKTFRKWLSEQVNIHTILKVASGTFEHAGVKTNVVIFTKDGPTQNIRFMETTKQCNTVKDMFTISSEELKSAGYSLDVGEYLVEETDNYDVPMVALGEVCDIVNGNQLDKKNIKEGEYPVFGGGKKNVGSHNEYNRNGGETIVCGTGAYCGFVQRISTPYWASQCFTINTNTDTLLSNYLYYLSKYSLETKFMNSKKGGGQPYIRGSQFNNLKIPLPSLEVQQQIVDELSQIETSIQTIESRITQLKCEKNQYKKYGRKAEIREMLKDSEMKMLGEVCEFKNYKYIKRCDMIKGEYKVIGGGKKPSGFHNKFNREPNTILCSGTGSYAGYISKYSTPVWASESFSIHSNNKDKLNELYLYLYLINIQEYLYSKRPASGGQPHIYPKTISKIKIPLPSLEVQQQCITLFEEKEKFIKSIDDKINTEKEYITHLKEMAKDVISSFC